MSKAVAIREESAAVDRYADPGIERTLKETVCKGATDSQFKMFVEICRGTGLNPFLKEIWFVPGVGVMAGRDGYLRVANEHPMFDGMQTLVERDANGIPVKATCSVWRKDRSHPITCEAYYNEYKKTSQVWTTYKSAMISKVAEVLALKRSFSINGVVSEEEIGEQQPQPERGSREAQKAVVEEKIARMNAGNFDPPPVHDAEFIEEPPSNLAPVLEASITNAQEQKGEADKFKALDEFKDLKAKIKQEMGTEDLYYQVLGANGYEKSNQIPRPKLREVYRAVRDAFLDWKRRQPMEGLGV